jgi:hypothetical protein
VSAPFLSSKRAEILTPSPLNPDCRQEASLFSCNLADTHLVLDYKTQLSTFGT